MVRILIVDDEEDIRLILRETLEERGYEVVEASDGDEALQHYWATPTDLVITDMGMPVKHGVEMIRELHRQTPSAKIIVMSGGNRFANPDWLVTATQLGVQRVFRKPFRLSEMFEAVREVLQSREDERRCLNASQDRVLPATVG